MTEFTKKEFEMVRGFLYGKFLPMMQEVCEDEITSASFIVLSVMETDDDKMCSQMVVHSDASEEALQIARDSDGAELKAAMLDIPISAQAIQAAANSTKDVLEDGIQKAMFVQMMTMALEDDPEPEVEAES